MSLDVFVDANVLLYSLFADSAWHIPARAKLKALETSGLTMLQVGRCFEKYRLY